MLNPLENQHSFQILFDINLLYAKEKILIAAETAFIVTLFRSIFLLISSLIFLSLPHK